MLRILNGRITLVTFPVKLDPCLGVLLHLIILDARESERMGRRGGARTAKKGI